LIFIIFIILFPGLPRNIRQTSCHCERSEAISFSAGTADIPVCWLSLRLLRRRLLAMTKMRKSC